MPDYSLSTDSMYHRNFNIVNYCEVREKDDSLISKTEIRYFDPSIIKHNNFNMTFAVPIYYGYELISTMGIYFKRQLTNPELIIIYSNSNTQERTNQQIERLSKEYFWSRYNIEIDLDKIRSINLNSILNAVLTKGGSNVEEIKVSYRHHYLGFNTRITLNYKSSNNTLYDYVRDKYINTYAEYIEIKTLNILNVKKSMLKLIDQLNIVINYDQIGRENIIKMLTKLGFNPRSSTIHSNITDVINCNKFATIDDDFIDFWNAMSWDNKFNEFVDIFKNTIISNNKSESRSLNIRGIQFIIKDKISYTLPILIREYVSTQIDSLKLCYAMLLYFNSYETFTNAISLVKLRSLSAS